MPQIDIIFIGFINSRIIKWFMYIVLRINISYVYI